MEKKCAMCGKMILPAELAIHDFGSTDVYCSVDCILRKSTHLFEDSQRLVHIALGRIANFKVN